MTTPNRSRRAAMPLRLLLLAGLLAQTAHGAALAGADPAQAREAGVEACDVFRDAFDYITGVAQSSGDAFGETRDFADPQDTFLMSQAIAIDEHWQDRVGEAITGDVPQSVRAALAKVVKTGYEADKKLVQHRPDGEYVPSSHDASYALETAQHVCGNYTDE